MVEAVHALGAHALVQHVAVPAFPDGGGTVVHRIEPAGVLALEEQLVGDVHHTVVGERSHEDGRAQEARLQAVVVVGKVLAQTLDDCFLGCALHQMVLQGEEGRGLHGVEDVGLEGSVLVEEGFLQIGSGSSLHGLILGSVASGGLGHVAHHAGIHAPVAGTQIAPVYVCLGTVHVVAVLVDHADGAGAALQGLIAQPVGPLEVGVVGSQCVVVILGFVDGVHEFLHRFPALVDDGGVAKLLPHHPGNDDAGICPSHAEHVAGFRTILCLGSHTGIAALRALGVTHVAQPLVEEAVGIGKEGTGLGEHLCVGCPAKTLVALWAVGGHRQIVGTLSPLGVADEAVYRFVTRGEGTYLHVLCNGGDGQRLDLLDAHFIGGCDGHEAVAVEGALGMIGHIAVVLCKGVLEKHADVGDAQVGAVATALRTVHAAALGSVAVVEQLGGEAGELGAFLGTEHERGNGCTVLAEVDDQCLFGLDDHLLAGFVFSGDDHGAIVFLIVAGHPFPHVSLLGIQGQVGAQVDFGTVGGQDLTLELVVLLGSGEFFGSFVARKDAGVILFAVEDGSVRYRTGDTGLPVFRVGAEDGGGAVSVGHLHYAPEGHLTANHAVVSAGGDDLVGPPSRGHLYGQRVLGTCFGGEGIGDVVGERAFGLLVMGESGL